MKTLKFATTGLLIAAFFAAPLCALGADAKTDKDPVAKTVKPKPYTLKTCIVSDDKLGGDMGDPVVFAYKDREVKLCCKDCRKDFDKEPAKFIKKLEAAEKKAAEKGDKAVDKK